MSGQLEGWLKADNLRAFVVAISWIIDYPFDDSDWMAIKGGVQSESPDGWYYYPLGAETVVELFVAQRVDEDTRDLRLQIPDAPICLREKISTVWTVFNRFDIGNVFDMGY